MSPQTSRLFSPDGCATGCTRAKDDQRLSGLLKHAWLESGGVYGYRKLTLDMRDLGERCGKHRVARLLRLAGLRSQTGYWRRPGPRGARPRWSRRTICSGNSR